MYKFYGMVIKPGKVEPYVPFPEENLVLYIKKAVAVATDAKTSLRKTNLFIRSKNNKQFLCISTLDTVHNISVNLDLPLSQYTEFKLIGDSEVTVHLTGYIQKEIGTYILIYT